MGCNALCIVQLSRQGFGVGEGECWGGGEDKVVRVQGVGGLEHVRRTRQAGEFVNLD